MGICRFWRPSGWITLLCLSIGWGCHHNPYANPYAPAGNSNPWATPNAAMPPSTTWPPAATPQSPPSTTPGIPPGYAPPAATPPLSSSPSIPNTGIQGPNWGNPGTLQQQRQQANVFDPFANNEVGPEIVGGRPRDFQKPMTEAQRAQPDGFRASRIPF